MSAKLLDSVDPTFYDGYDDDECFERLAPQARSMSFLPEIDPFTGIKETMAWDEETRRVLITRTQDCDAILDNNAEMRNGNFDGWRNKEDKWIPMASIPNLVIEEWLIKEGWCVYDAKCDRNGVPNDPMRRLLGKLRDPDWYKLKTHDMDFGDGKQTGMTRTVHIPGNGLIWGKL